MTAAGGAAAGEKRILVVDDQPDLRLLVREALDDGASTYRFREAGNGAEAFAALREFRPQVVVLDVMLPGGVDGYRICEFIKTRSEPGPPIYVILLTARGQQADIEKGRAVRADLYLVKPISLVRLIDAVERAFAVSG